jgi:glucose/arabinose dehydrogenase
MFHERMSFRTALLAGALMTVTATAAAQTATLDPGEMQALKIEGWVNNVANVMDLTFLPDGRAVILHRAGDITIRTKDGMLLRNVAHVPIKPLTATEHGLLGVVAHPDFAQNHTIFLHASIGDTVADKDQVVRATVSDDNKLTIDYANPILKIESPEKHNGSMMVIQKGLLWMAVGDTGADATPPVIRYSSCLNKPNGKILRMNLDGSAAADNPLSNLAMVTGCTTEARTSGSYTMQPPDKRIWAWGFRQPYRFWVDPVTDLVWVGDVGEKAYEEVDIVSRGQHHGFPFEEGSTKYNQGFMPPGGCKGMVPSTECAAPAYQYANGSNGDGGVIAGFILDACGWPEAYRSRYLYGDFNAGHIYTLQVTPDRKGIVAGSRKPFGTFRTLNGFKMGPDGAVYMTAYDATAIFRVLPKEIPASCNQAPAADAGATPTADAGAADAAAAGTGGAPGTGGSPGTGGRAGTGGSPGTGGRASGGAGGTAGEPEEGGSGGGSKPAGRSSGCAAAGSPGAGALVLLALAFMARGLRRRR